MRGSSPFLLESLNGEVPTPFRGQACHCPLISDPFREQGKTPLENGTYVDSLLCGGMNSKSLSGIRRGATLRTNCDQVVKKHNFMEIYFDPTLAVNHGSQELSTKKVDLPEDFNCCIPIPLHEITEPPCYVALKDGDKCIHKRDLCQSGEWCQYSWGPAHDKGFKCIYYNFCKYCLSFQPQDKNFRDFKTKSHLCNYDITEMSKQKARLHHKAPKLHEQVFSEERSAQVKDLQHKADLVNNEAAKLLQQKIKRKREQVAKSKADVQQKRDKALRKRRRSSPPRTGEKISSCIGIMYVTH